MSRPIYSIKFPLIKERTSYKNKNGKRFRLVTDTTGLFGARACAGRMINSAMLYRDHSYGPKFDRSERLAMRVSALWARVFAGQIDQNDPRIDAASKERTRTVNELCQSFAA